MHDRDIRRLVCLGMVVVVLGGLGSYQLSRAEDRSFIHQPAYQNPLVPRLTRRVTMDYFDGNPLFATPLGAAVTHYVPASGNSSSALLVSDFTWRRLVTAKDGSNAIKSWGRDDAVPARNLGCPAAIVTDNGNPLANDWKTNVYVVDAGPHPRILRLIYDFSSENLSFADSLTLTSDNIVELSDLDRHDNGTPADPSDDYIWAVDLMGYRLLKYSCFGPHGIVAQYGGVHGTNPGQLYYPERIAIGRGLNGAHNDEIYVLDKRRKNIIKLLDDGSGRLSQVASYDCAGLQMACPSDIVVDAYGQLYVVDECKSKIFKFTRDFELLATYDNSGPGGEQISMPHAITNASATQGINGWGDLFVQEAWTNSSGGQWYALGVSASSGAYHLDPSQPNVVRLSYFATDPHYLRLEPYRWDTAAKYWIPLTPVQYLKYSGLTDDVYWSAGGGPCGNVADYKFVLRLTSTYSNFIGDSLVIEATLGDGGGIQPEGPLTFNSSCFYYNQRYSARWRAQPSPCVGGSLTYTWSSNYNNVWFYVDSVAYRRYTGSRDSVDVVIEPRTLNSEDALPGEFISVNIADHAGHQLNADRTIDHCHCPMCPAPGDLNRDGFVDVFDVVAVVNIAYSGGVDIRDTLCPTTRADVDRVNSPGMVDVFDVIKMVDMAFTGGVADDPCL